MENATNIYKNAIIINGYLGTGKTKLGENLVIMLNKNSDKKYSSLSTGNFFRAEAERRGITLGELGELQEKDSSVDLKIDETTKKYLEDNDYYIVDTRMGAYLKPTGTFKVLLIADEHVAAQRILDDKDNPKRNVEAIQTLEEVIKQNRKRVESEKTRYMALYNFDHFNKEHYDFILDTTFLSETEVADIVCIEYGIWKINPETYNSRTKK